MQYLMGIDGVIVDLVQEITTAVSDFIKPAVEGEESCTEGDGQIQVELMGGHLNVTSRVNSGSTITFVLPYKISPKEEHSDDPDQLSYMDEHEGVFDANTDDTDSGIFYFQPATLGSLFSPAGSTRTQKAPTNNIGYGFPNKLNGLSEESYAFPSNNCTSRETASLEDACSWLMVERHHPNLKVHQSRI